MSDRQPSEIVSAWLQHAPSDLRLGGAALHMKDILPEDICFHAQQRASIVLAWVEDKIG